MATRNPGAAVSAAKLARERMAELADKRREVKALDTEDLAAYLRGSDAVVRAETKRDTTIAAANKDFETAVTDAHNAQAAALQRIHARGVTSESELAELAGLGVAELRKLLRATVTAAAPVKRAPRKGTASATATDDGAARSAAGTAG